MSHDHRRSRVTAEAIGEQLGLGPGVISGPELQALSNQERTRGRRNCTSSAGSRRKVKLRPARTMQQQGLIVTMTGDAANNAAALKQADSGMAIGNGSVVASMPPA